MHDYEMIYIYIVSDIMKIRDESAVRKNMAVLLYTPKILSAAFMAEEKLMSPEQPSPRTVSPIK